MPRRRPSDSADGPLMPLAARVWRRRSLAGRASSKQVRRSRPGVPPSRPYGIAPATTGLRSRKACSRCRARGLVDAAEASAPVLLLGLRPLTPLSVRTYR
jgi:hypothetical protein